MSTTTITTTSVTLEAPKAPKAPKAPEAPETTGAQASLRTAYTPNPDFVPPADFVLPLGLVPVPLNPKGPTQIPYKVNLDFDNDPAQVGYKYKHLLPYNTLTAEPPLAPYEHVDVASRADPAKAALLGAFVPGGPAKRRDLTPTIGTEVWGLQLSSLTDTQKDELALLAAERGVVVFRGQDFVDRGSEWMKQFGSYFGRLHVHQWGLHPRDQPELNIVYRDSDVGTFLDIQKEGQLNTLSWHTDMSYEVNPPATTFLATLAGPDVGGDTLYLDASAAYDRLSEPVKAFLETLQAVHSGVRQNRVSTKTNLARRPGIDTVHPVVRRHPVTGRKALWVNVEYTTHIVGLRQPESDNLLRFLFDHLYRGIDFHTRVRWEPGTVVVYDNRMTQHSVTLDYPLDKDTKRHLVRVTPQGEVPSI